MLGDRLSGWPGRQGKGRGGPRTPLGEGIVSEATAGISDGTRGRVRASVRLAVLEGIPSSAVLGVVNNFLVPCALALKATTFQVGLVGAIPNIGAAAAQLGAPGLTHRLRSPKKLLLLSVLLGVPPWLALAAIVPFGSTHAIWLLIFFAMMALVFYHLPNAAWGSWISSLTTARTRGRILGSRAGMAALATMVVFLIGGVLLDLVGTRVLIGFAAVFAAAAVLRAASFFLLKGMYEPPRARRQPASAGMLAFFRSLPRSSMGRFLACYGAFMFAANLGGPFYTVFLLRDLEYSYTSYTIIMFIPSLTGVLAPYFWGRLADRRGNLRVLLVVCWAVALLPLLWVAGHAFWWMLLIQLASGAMWAGFNLVAVNYVYDASRPNERTTHIAGLYVTHGLAAFCGSLTGGAIAGHLPAVNGYSLLTLFLLSGLLRVAACLVLLPRIREAAAPRFSL